MAVNGAQPRDLGRSAGHASFPAAPSAGFEPAHTAPEACGSLRHMAWSMARSQGCPPDSPHCPPPTQAYVAPCPRPRDDDWMRPPVAMASIVPRISAAASTACGSIGFTTSTASTPRTARATSPASRRSATTTSAPNSLSAAPRAASRTTARTATLRPSSSRTAAPPTLPFAPKTASTNLPADRARWRPAPSPLAGQHLCRPSNADQVIAPSLTVSLRL
jgi:hypothetical protein